MKTPSATPYLVPPDSCVSGHPWTTVDGRPLTDRLEHWDPFTDIELVRTIQVDVDGVRDACQLGPDATFSVAATWRSSRTRLAGEVVPVELGDHQGLVMAPIRMTVPGAASGGRLDLTTLLALRYAGQSASVISPRRDGAVLWSDEARVALEGGASRFPVAAVDFAAAPGLPQDGSWALEWNPEELSAPVLSGLRLLVNSSATSFIDALRTGSSDSRSSVIRSFVLFDVAQSLVNGALTSEQFVADPESFEQGSIGRMLFDLLAMCWPGVPISALVGRLKDHPARLSAELQAHLAVFE